MRFQRVTAQQFLYARAGAPRQHMFTPITPAALLDRMLFHGTRAFLDEMGCAGFLVTKEGDLQSVFNCGAPGAGARAVEASLWEGAVTLDCFDGFLPAYYARFGFKETGRAPFDPALAPPGWNVAEHGAPDVIFMRRTPH